jgi:hypothetical protein
LGYEQLYNQIRLDEPWDSEHNKQFHIVGIQQIIDQIQYNESRLIDHNNSLMFIYHCPNNPQWGCSYSAIAGGYFIPAKEAGSVVGMKFESTPDAPNRTKVLVEVEESFNWMDPTADVTLEEFVRRERVGTCSRDPLVWMRGIGLDGTVGSPLADATQDWLREIATPSSTGD